MALATLLLPSSASTAGGGDHSESRRHDHHHHVSKRKKKPPPSPQPSLQLPPRTPPTGPAGSSRIQRGTSSSSMKSPKVATAAAAAKNNPPHRHRRAPSTTKKASASSSSSWEQVKSLLSCRSATAAARVHDPAAPSALARLRGGGAGACGASLCAMRDVVDAASSAASSAAAAAADRDTAPLNRRRAHRGTASSSAAGGGGGHHSSLRGLSGCYECRAINVEPMSRRYPRPRELCACPQCGEVFTKVDSLEHHQAIRHAVSELGPEDSGRNIVEIIFKSSWQKSDGRRSSACHIDRILKVHNAPRTVARFEAYRDAVRSRCRAARAAADGNELLRFHSAPLACALGLDGATCLCDAGGGSDAASCCGVCTAIRHGFAAWAGAHPLGVRTTASSGRAHDCGGGSISHAAAATAGCRAMLVCRVIAGRVRRDGDAGAASSSSPSAAAQEEGPPFDSVAGEDAASSSVYGNLEELFVANPRAILPCFVVIYRVLES